MTYFWNVLIAIDQLGNAVLGGNPDETISSRMGKAIRERRCYLCRVICWFLDKIDKDHCKESIEEDEI
jgi:hypothetical protein